MLVLEHTHKELTVPETQVLVIRSSQERPLSTEPGGRGPSGAYSSSPSNGQELGRVRWWCRRPPSSPRACPAPAAGAAVSVGCGSSPLQDDGCALRQPRFPGMVSERERQLTRCWCETWSGCRQTFWTGLAAGVGGADEDVAYVSSTCTSSTVPPSCLNLAAHSSNVRVTLEDSQTALDTRSQVFPLRGHPEQDGRPRLCCCRHRVDLQRGRGCQPAHSRVLGVEFHTNVYYGEVC